MDADTPSDEKPETTETKPAPLFGKTGEARSRLKAVLDALDFVACESGDGWIRLAVWAGRIENVGGSVTPGALSRQWSRKLHNMRKHGIDYYCYATEEGTVGVNQAWGEKPLPFELTAIRLSAEGNDRLRALVSALDAWLVSREDGDV